MNPIRKSAAVVAITLAVTACGVVSSAHMHFGTNDQRANNTFRDNSDHAPVLARTLVGHTPHVWAAMDLSYEALRGMGFRIVNISREKLELKSEWRPLAQSVTPTSRPACDDGLSTAMRVHVSADRGSGEFYVDGEIRQSASAPADSRAARELFDDVADALSDAVRRSAERPDTLTINTVKTDAPREPDGRNAAGCAGTLKGR